VVFSALAAALFFGGWSGPGVSYSLDGGVAGGWPFVLLGVFWFIVKIFGFLFLYFWLRASLPRFRYDQLMRFGWKVLVPLGLFNILFMGLYYAIREGWFI